MNHSLTHSLTRPHHFWGNKSRSIAPCEAVVATQPWKPTPDLSVTIEPVQEELCPVSRRRTTAPPSAIAGSRQLTEPENKSTPPRHDTSSVRMLLSPRTYQQLQILQQGSKSGTFESRPAIGWRVAPDTVHHREKMLLVHQIGSVRVGEVVRYLRSTSLWQSLKPNQVQIYFHLYAFPRPNTTLPVLLARQDQEHLRYTSPSCLSPWPVHFVYCMLLCYI